MKERSSTLYMNLTAPRSAPMRSQKISNTVPSISDLRVLNHTCGGRGQQRHVKARLGHCWGHHRSADGGRQGAGFSTGWDMLQCQWRKHSMCTQIALPLTVSPN